MTDKNNDLVFTTESIDSFIAEGMTTAAKEVGLGDHSLIDDACKGPGDKTNILWTFIEDGNPIAYLIYTVSDSLKNGFPSNRIAPYILKKRSDQKINVLRMIEIGRKLIDSPEYQKLSKKPFSNNIRVPILKDMADFLMLSMSINKRFLHVIPKEYTENDLDYKTCAYYGQSSRDIKEENRKEVKNQFIDQAGFYFLDEGFSDIVKYLERITGVRNDLNSIYNDIKIITHVDLNLEEKIINKIDKDLDNLYKRQKKREGVAKAVYDIAHNIQPYKETMNLFSSRCLN